MKQLTTTLNGKEILLVEVPEDATCAIELTYGGDKIVCWYDCGFSEIEIKNPGDWKPLGLASDIPEEIAAGLVETVNWWNGPNKGKFAGYQYYGRQPRMNNYEKTAIKSLWSFITSQRVNYSYFNPSTTVILIKE